MRILYRIFVRCQYPIYVLASTQRAFSLPATPPHLLPSSSSLTELKVRKVVEHRKGSVLRERVGHGALQALLHVRRELHADVEGQLRAPARVRDDEAAEVGVDPAPD